MNQWIKFFFYFLVTLSFLLFLLLCPPEESRMVFGILGVIVFWIIWILIAFKTTQTLVRCIRGY